MATLAWDQVGDRYYETGVSKGVLYGYDGMGIVWNGLTSIEQDVEASTEPIYFDGVKFNDLITVGDFSATLRAFTYPDEFLYYEGILEDQTGFYVGHQAPNRFSLSYQTDIGNDINELGYGYKIHILYNLTAIPAQVQFQSLSLDTNPVEFEWSLTAIPEEIENFRPTAHVIFDSRKMDPHLLRDIEGILYGDDTQDAHLPSLKGLSSFIRKWDRLIITDHGDGTWSAETQEEGYISMIDDTTFQIDTDTAEYLDPETYNIWSSNKNEEDIWLP